MTAWRYILASLRQFGASMPPSPPAWPFRRWSSPGRCWSATRCAAASATWRSRALGRTDTVVLAQHPFRAALAEEIRASPAANNRYADSVPLLLTQGAATFRTAAGEIRRATSLNVYGVNCAVLGAREPWRWIQPRRTPGRRHAAPPHSRQRNRTHRECRPGAGRPAGRLCRSPHSAAQRHALPTALSAKRKTPPRRVALRWRRSSASDDAQRWPASTCFPRRSPRETPSSRSTTLQDLLKLEGKANAVLLALPDAESATSPQSVAELAAELRPTLADSA